MIFVRICMNNRVFVLLLGGLYDCFCVLCCLCTVHTGVLRHWCRGQGLGAHHPRAASGRRTQDRRCALPSRPSSIGQSLKRSAGSPLFFFCAKPQVAASRAWPPAAVPVNRHSNPVVLNVPIHYYGTWYLVWCLFFARFYDTIMYIGSEFRWYRAAACSDDCTVLYTAV